MESTMSQTLFHDPTLPRRIHFSRLTGWSCLLLASCVCGPGIQGQEATQLGRDGSASATAQAKEASTLARGVVFHDQNGNRRREPRETGLPGIRVSNGLDIVTTDEQGRYELPVTDDTILFVLKPRDWTTPLSELKTPEFYYIHKPKGSPPSRYAGVAPTGELPKSIDFPLYPRKEPNQFKALLFGDPQPRNQEEVDYISHDVVEELIGSDAAFGVTLGDIAFDNLNTLRPLSESIALIGIPWYNVIGNHDLNFEARTDELSDETFERHYGPSYYSFDYGPTHFIVLDDVEWRIPEGAERGKYRGGLGPRQIQFIENDLRGIPADQMVVLMMHIPLHNIHDRQPLYRLIEKRPFCISISGHTHHHEHRFIKQSDGWMGPEPHHHIVNVTVSGSWWSGAPDERGIPHTTMADGAPNGYSILSFDGVKYKLDYKAAGRDDSYQMQIHGPEEVKSSELDKVWFYVNYFNGSERDRVEFRVGQDGSWQAMKKSIEVDPALQAAWDREHEIADKQFRDLSKPKPSTHLWKTTLPATVRPGVQLLQIRVQDMFGRTHTSQRVIRIVADPEGQALPASTLPEAR